MKNNYIWYACYGSNLLRERFMLYITGGKCRFNGKRYDGCTDKSEPLEEKAISISYTLYFAKHSPSWSNCGVAFLMPEKDLEAATLGKAYKITEEQFDDVHRQEGKGWYDKILDLGMVDGTLVKTFTHSVICPSNKPSQEYFEVVSLGLKETYPQITDEQIKTYLLDSL